MKPFMLIVVVALSVFTGTRLANAAQRGAARVTQVVQDVKLLISQAPPKPATVSDNVVSTSSDFSYSAEPAEILPLE
jgi:hypothetical protein